MKNIGWLALSVLSTLVVAPMYAEGIATKTTQQAVQTQRLTDGQILAIILAVDQSEMAAAKEIDQKGVQGSVREYADYLYQQHHQNSLFLTKLAQQLHITPVSSTIETSVKTDGVKGLHNLQALTGPSLDTAYMSAMVKGHAGGLHLIDTTLLKDVSNPQLKAAIVSFRKIVAHHEALGLKVQTNLEH